MNPETEKLIRDICAFIHIHSSSEHTVVDVDSLLNVIAESTRMSNMTLCDWLDEEWEKLDT